MRTYPTGSTAGAGSQRWERISTGAIWALIGFVALLGIDIAVRSRGVVPDYDALTYLDQALDVHLGFLGALHGSGHFEWAGLGLTNSLDVLLLALVYDLMDVHVAVWAIHTGYLVLFAMMLRRVAGTPSALIITAWAFASSVLMHQYTTFISELKVGLLLVLFIVYLFHPDAPRHRAALFWLTVLLVLLRTINLLFVLPLAGLFVALRWLEPPRRREIGPVIMPVFFGIAVLAPLLFEQVPGLMAYIAYNRGRQNWIDMSGVRSFHDLLWTYLRGILEYNRLLQLAIVAIAAIAALVLLTRHRRRLLELRDPALGIGLILAVLLQAGNTNFQVIFWLFALEALVAGLLLRALLGPALLTLAGTGLAFFAAYTAYGGFLDVSRNIAAGSPVQSLARDVASAIATVDTPWTYRNYGGVGPLDVPGLEVRMGVALPKPGFDVFTYQPDPRYFMQGLPRSNVALIANRNFFWPPYVGVNRHTEEIARLMEEQAARYGWTKTQTLLYDGDPNRHIDVYVRPTVRVALKWRQWGDAWLDVDTPVQIKAPSTQPIAANYRLEITVVVPRTGDASFVPPVKATLADATGKPVATAEALNYGDNTLTFPVGGVEPGGYRLQFDRSFTSADPRKLVAILKEARLVIPEPR